MIAGTFLLRVKFMKQIKSIKSWPKNRLFVAQFVFWLGAVLMMFVLWDLWFIPGPHGPFRWVGSDYIPYWVGVREMFSGVIPYSAETTLKIQQVLYGGPALDHDPMMFLYPAWLFILIAPFALLPIRLSVAIFAGTLLWVLINLLYLFARQWSGQNQALRIGWLLILVIGSLPFIVISVVRGQLGYLTLFAFFAARRLWDKKPFWAGVLLSFAVIKPTVAILPVIGFLFWALLERNWKYISGFALSFTILFVTSVIVVGNWFLDYFSFLTGTWGMPVLWSLNFLWWPWQILYVGFFVGIMIYALFISWRQKQRDFWCSAIILTGTALLPMRWIYDLYLFILIPSEERELPKISSIMVGIAIMAPWSLALFPERLQWSAALIGLPLIWAIALLTIQSQKNI